MTFHDQNYANLQLISLNRCRLSATVGDRTSAACWKSLPVVCGCRRFNT